MKACVLVSAMVLGLAAAPALAETRADVRTITIAAGAPAGTDKYLCTFPGHYAAGMWGDLIVKKQAL